jgi:two-component system sensor histidine kinase BaeS
MDMRRRLVATIAGVMTAAVVVVGLGTLALTTAVERRDNQDELQRRVEEMAGVLSEVRPRRVEPLTLRIAPALDVDTIELIRTDVPNPSLSEEDMVELRNGVSVSGRDGDTAHAAAPLAGRRGGTPTRALLATDSVEPGIGPATRWLILASVVTVVLGGLVASRLARRLSRPLQEAETTARRIAQGDLSARIDTPGRAHGRHDADERHGDEVVRLVDSINSMAASLQHAQGLERDFLLSVSHDLRTPLTSISGWAEALADGNAPDPARAGTTILTEAGRLDRLVRDLLDLARLRAKSFRLDPRPVDLRDVAAGAAEGLRPDLEDARLRVAVEAPAEPVVVEGDPDRLAQVAANLIENAGRYAATSVRVRVEVHAAGVNGGPGPSRGPTAVLAVEDDGQGIPEAERPHLFERMYAGARPPARVGGGTGLGLTIVRELAQAMHGDADVGEAADGGARFEVRLPLVPQPAQAVRPPAPQQPLPPLPRRRPAGEQA